jgi:AcrR family transcriptional regulator
MDKSELKKGRVKQKLQTRTEILEAAKILMQEEKKITLEDIAKKAKVSRATMYRYYSNIDILFTEASLDVRHKAIEELLKEVQDLNFADRILYIQNHYNQSALNNETTFRRYLSAVLSESILSKEQIRGARRVKVLEKVLEPFRNKFSPDNYKNLINISSVLMGIDPIIVCKDVCSLNSEETNNTLKWALELILNSIPFED